MRPDSVPTRVRQLLEPGYALLLVGVVALSAWNVQLNSERRAFMRQLRDSRPGLSGAASCQVGDTVPSIRSVGVDGKPASLTYDGPQRYLLFIFDPRCGVCVHDTPIWKSLASEAASGGVAVRWISLASAELTVPKYSREKVKGEVVLMPGMSIQRAYRVTSVPQLLVVAPGGTVEWVHNGALSSETQRRLREVLR